MSVSTLVLQMVASFVHFYSLKSDKPNSHALMDSARLRKTKINLSWITIATTVLSAGRSGLALISLFNLISKGSVEFNSVLVYLTLTLSPWLEMVGHLVLAQFSTLLQMVGVVLDEVTENVQNHLFETRKHFLCVQLMRDLNRIYAWQIFLIFLSVDIQILQSSYFMGINVIRILYTAPEALRFSAILDFSLNLMLFSYASVQLLMMVDAGEKINRKVSK